MTNPNNIEQVLRDACDRLRGKLNIESCSTYIVPMFFMKYISDNYKEKKEEYAEQYNGNTQRIKRALDREFIRIEETTSFDFLYENRDDSDIGQKINNVLLDIETQNADVLRNIFRNIDYNNIADFGDTKTKNSTIRDLLEIFNCLDLRPSQLESEDMVGNAYEKLLEYFCMDAGRTGAIYFTPEDISTLLAKLMKPQANDSIYDPVCGTGSLLLKVYKEVKNGNATVSGQELSLQIWSLCKLNMIFHGIYDAKIWQGDTLSNPLNIEDDNLEKFQVIVAEPPFSVRYWDHGFLMNTSENKEGKMLKKMEASMDPWNRFSIGVPPSSKGDYAFVLHMLSCLNPDNGRMAVVLPHGVLFRGTSERSIRKELIERNVIDAVIGLPNNMLYRTSIPICVLVFKKNREQKDVLFIDASGEDNYVKQGKQNVLRDSDISRIVRTYEKRETIDKYAYIVTKEEIANNDYDLSISRYVDTTEHEVINIEEVKKTIEELEAELAEVQLKIRKYME